jgi:hypothetical protein
VLGAWTSHPSLSSNETLPAEYISLLESHGWDTEEIPSTGDKRDTILQLIDRGELEAASVVHALEVSVGDTHWRPKHIATLKQQLTEASSRNPDLQDSVWTAAERALTKLSRECADERRREAQEASEGKSTNVSRAP